MLTEGYSDTEYECGDYDELGNPWTYKSKALTWDNLRTLKSYDNVSFTYDKNGNRISKTISTTSTDEDGNQVQSSVTKRFYLEGNRLIMQDNGDNSIVDSSTGETCSTRLYFHYGADGLTGFTYRNGKVASYYRDYFYKKNAQGDIIGIYDYNGSEVVRYYYDAWGNQKIYYTIGYSWYQYKEGETYTNALLAILNPFRYRGYIYDNETNLYYLNSRYYDPETGRFINADDVSVLDATSSVINGLNLYAYCLNNPVNETDESGYLIFSLLLAFIIGGTVSAISSVVTQGMTGGSVDSKIVLLDTIMGGIGSVISMLPIGILGQMAFGGLLSSFQYILGQEIQGEKVSNAGILFNFGLGAIFSMSDGALYGKMPGKQIPKTVFVNQIEKLTLSTISKQGLGSGLKYFTKHIGNKILKDFALDLIFTSFKTMGINITNEYLIYFSNRFFK